MRKKQKAEKKKNKKIKKQRKEDTTLHHLPSVTWRCTGKCGELRTFRINERNRPLYTEEREKTFVCVQCQ